MLEPSTIFENGWECLYKNALFNENHINIDPHIGHISIRFIVNSDKDETQYSTCCV